MKFLRFAFPVIFILAIWGEPANALTVFNTNTTIACGDLTYDGDDIVVDGATLTISCAHSFNSLVIQNNGVVTHPAGDAVGVQLTVATNLTVNANSRIDVNAKGFPAESGPGATINDTWCGGAAHGGGGGNGSSSVSLGSLVTYGSPTAPVTAGSGGGSWISCSNGGGPGGGILRLIVNGTLTANGQISADGSEVVCWAGGSGAGGSIWITATTITGTGTISARGGNGGPSGPASGGGGGGRIALYYDVFSFTGTQSACGGTGFSNGGAGSLYLKQTTSTGILSYHNCNTAGAVTPAVASDFTGALSITGRAIVIAGGTGNVESLTVSGNSTLRMAAVQALTMNVAADATIDATSMIDGVGRGYGAGAGPGTSSDGTWCGGAAHGGAGGDGQQGAGSGSTNCYGSAMAPITLGSGAGSWTSCPNGGGPGGGAIHLNVTGTLTLEGSINVDGSQVFCWAGGAGAGGSAYITTGIFTGSGSISARGGNGGPNGPSSGTGGGGRIAVYYNSSSFSGSMSACGGTGYSFGGAGSIYVKQNSADHGTLTYDNCSQNGGISRIAAEDLEGDVTTRNGATMRISGYGNIRSLWIHSSSSLQPDPLAVLDLTIETNARLDGSLNANGLGHPSGQGEGAGALIGWWAGGAAHAGVGGDGSGGPGSQITYGSFCQPTRFGSGGGQYLAGLGGAGGGAIHFTVTDTLVINGTLSANGQHAPNHACGGGSGGSIWLWATRLEGTGFITADGGNGWAPEAGGGGGGRIALYFCDSTFVPDHIHANAGTGWSGGAQATAGTIYVFNPVNPDCNNNSMDDRCEIALHLGEDCNCNHILDSCEPFSDPDDLTVEVSGGAVKLRWSCVPGTLLYYIYRSATPDVQTIPGNLVATVTEIEYVDVTPQSPPEFQKYFYRIVAER